MIEGRRRAVPREVNRHAFDPYPYILLNLVLSMMAGIQAPIIMMIQNRQTQKDRLDALAIQRELQTW